VDEYRGLTSGRAVSPRELEGRRVVAASAIADPDAFVAQTKATGAQLQVATWPDHHDFQDEDLAWLAKAARKSDFVVVTEKDAVKLRDRWPASVPEPLVARLVVTWEQGEAAITAGLDAVIARVDRR
jgi:tetraacyldisaccharide-1-P 4'-kinase